MSSWIKRLLLGNVCDTCGRNHRFSVIGVGNSYPSDEIHPGHEYAIVTDGGFSRPEIWRVGFLSTAGQPADGLLRFTAAKPGQDEETVIVLIYSDTIRSVKEVDKDKSKRHAGRSAIREVSRDK